ncbi:MAG TPA: hypothetical protein VIV12_24660 [Streptosporangiaceae bacterium]
MVVGIFGGVQAGPAASASVTWTSVPPINPGDYNLLTGVTVLSSSNVWAVGWYTIDDAVLGLIEHWDGTAWQQVPSPNPGGDVETSIYGERAASATNIWAVGSYQTSGGMKQTLILHWDGISWKQMPSPNPAGSTGANELYGVVAPSASNAWAVGNYTPSGSTEKTLVLHWNGLAWKRVTSPNPGSRGNTLSAVAASSTTAWAVGWSSSGTNGKTLALRWNGTAWKQVGTPSPGPSRNFLQAVRFSSSSNAWAVGSYYNGTADQTLILHWNGTAWKRVSSPNPQGSGGLSGVGGFSSTNIWAVGTGDLSRQALAIHCC